MRNHRDKIGFQAVQLLQRAVLLFELLVGLGETGGLFSDHLLQTGVHLGQFGPVSGNLFIGGLQSGLLLLLLGQIVGSTGKSQAFSARGTQRPQRQRDGHKAAILPAQRELARPALFEAQAEQGDGLAGWIEQFLKRFSKQLSGIRIAAGCQQSRVNQAQTAAVITHKGRLGHAVDQVGILLQLDFARHDALASDQTQAENDGSP